MKHRLGNMKSEICILSISSKSKKLLQNIILVVHQEKDSWLNATIF